MTSARSPEERRAGNVADRLLHIVNRGIAINGGKLRTALEANGRAIANRLALAASFMARWMRLPAAVLRSYSMENYVES